MRVDRRPAVHGASPRPGAGLRLRRRCCRLGVDAVGGRLEVYLDGGITSGADIVAALAMGATGTLVGRAYLYGLMAGGADGVRRAVDILAAEVGTTMQLLGVRSVGELDRSYVRLRD